MEDKDFWENRYANNDTGWDIGSVSYPLKQYVDQVVHKEIKILIPGAGNGHEAEYLWNIGFKNIYILDIAQQPLNNLKNRIPEIPLNQLLYEDFFKLKGQFDLIIEQTFFCAINPKLRLEYKNKMLQLLKSNGKLVGLLFNFELTESGPPFGGSKTEYQSLFENDFKIKTLEPSINSIKQRQGKELFFIFEKKT